MAEFFGKGISVGSGFDLGANLPLDNRTVQATLADRDSMPTIQLVEGLFVYVKENKTAYILKGFDPDGSNRVWETLATGTVVEIINSLESDRTDAALSAAQGKALKTLVDDLKASVAAALDYKGTKDTYDALPTEGNKKGDVWNVVAAHGTTPAGTNYAWDGTQWDPLGGTVDLSGYYTKTQVDDAISTAKTELEAADTALEGQITTELAKKLNIGASGDASTVQSYYGLKKYTDEAKSSAISSAKSYTDTEIGKIPAAIVYKGDGTTVTQSGTSTVTFAVGEIPQSKVTSLTTDLAAKATTTALNAVKATADAAAPQATTYTKKEVDNKVASAVGSVYKMKGSVDDAAALTALTGVVIGDVYNVVAAGTLNGEAFEAGSNFVAIKAGAGTQTEMWDKLGGTIDLSAYAKSADVANTYATKTAVTSEISTKIETLDKADAAVAGQVVSAVSETDGIITVSRRALVADDIPTLATSKISGLNTALNGKVPTTRTVNSKPLSANVVLAGADILVGGDGTYSESDLQAAIEAMDGRITSAAASGVQSFGGQTGAITVDTANTTNGQVKFSISSKQLKGTVNGLKSAAYTESSAYATSAQGTKADSAIQAVNGTTANYITASKNSTTVTISSTIQAVASASSSAKGLAEASDVKAYADSLMTWAEFE